MPADTDDTGFESADFSGLPPVLMIFVISDEAAMTAGANCEFLAIG
jgi:hypothetical protein